MTLVDRGIGDIACLTILELLERQETKNTKKEIAMLTPKINNAIEALVDAIREASPEMTTFTLSMNCEERRIETSKRTPEQIKAAGIPMQEVVGCLSLPELLLLWETVRAEILRRKNEQTANGDRPAGESGNNSPICS